MFIGREKEMSSLREFFSSSGRKAGLVFGKRRVGKTTLLLEASKGFDGRVIFFECGKVSLEKNTEALAGIVSSSLGITIGGTDLESIFSIFRLLSEKVLVIIDEYQYLKKKSDDYEVDSVFKRIIDNMSANTKLILNGSSIAVMKDTLTYSNPLYGRFDLIINLTEFDYLDASVFYPGLSVRDRISFHAVFGGSPYVLSLIDYEKTLEENIRRLLLERDGALRTYIEYIVSSELGGMPYLYDILSTLGNSKLRYSEIEDRIHVSSTGILSRYLGALKNMELIEVVAPINKAGDKKKQFYAIKDNLLRFYYTYIYANRGVINLIGVENFYERNIEPSINTFISYRFEEIAREYFSRQARKGIITPVNIGTYWYDDRIHKTNGEFDCVIQMSENEYMCYECKFYTSPMKEEDCRREIEKIRNASGVVFSRYGLVSSSGFTGNHLSDVDYVTGEDLYNI